MFSCRQCEPAGSLSANQRTSGDVHAEYPDENCSLMLGWIFAETRIRHRGAQWENVNCSGSEQIGGDLLVRAFDTAGSFESGIQAGFALLHAVRLGRIVQGVDFQNDLLLLFRKPENSQTSGVLRSRPRFRPRPLFALLAEGWRRANRPWPRRANHNWRASKHLQDSGSLPVDE